MYLFFEALLAVLGLLGTPLFAIIGGIGLLAFLDAGIDLSVVAIEMSRLGQTPLLVSLPFFLFAGNVLAAGGAPARLLAVFRLLFGRLPGGVACVVLLLCAVFTAFTGASGVTIFALGGLLYPALQEEGYPERFSLGLLTVSGSLGLLFPPSIPLILYAVVAGVPVGQLFLAGLLPGFLMLALIGLYAVFQGRELEKNKTAPPQGSSWSCLPAALWEMFLPLILFGGIYGGFFTVSEAAAVTALYVLAVELLVHRDLAPADIVRIVVRSAVMFGGITVILGASLATTNYLVDQEIPARLFELSRQYVAGRTGFLLLLNLFLILVGAMLDIFSALVLIVPLIIPLAQAYGVDPVHLGIIFLVNLQIGYATPPVGLSLFIASYRFGKPVTTLYRASLPFLALLVLVLLAVTFLPSLSLSFLHLKAFPL